MSEITELLLQPYRELTQEEKGNILDYLKGEAEKGFNVELQRDIIAWDGEQMTSLLVKRIEPRNRYYGQVNSETVFRIFEETVKKPILGVCGVKPPPPETVTTSEPPPEPPLNEIERLKALIDEVEALRARYGITYEYLEKLVSVVAEFGFETGSALEDTIL